MKWPHFRLGLPRLSKGAFREGLNTLILNFERKNRYRYVFKSVYIIHEDKSNKMEDHYVAVLHRF